MKWDRFNGYVYDEEKFTDYLGGPPEETALAALLQPGGYLHFQHDGTASHLIVFTEYLSSRPLTEVEIETLVDYTLGQWSDGIGENLSCYDPLQLGMSLYCQTHSAPLVKQFE